jgi:hypothetical protein
MCENDKSGCNNFFVKRCLGLIFSLNFSLISAALLCSAAQSVSAQTTATPTPGPHDALYMYKGADRDQKLLAQARKEARLRCTPR